MDAEPASEVAIASPTELELVALVWQGKSDQLRGLPAAPAGSWVGGVQADLMDHANAGHSLPPVMIPGTPYPKACLIMMARDEIDIISTNIRWHYSIGIRRMVVCDNRSSDGTLEALFLLREELADAEIIVVSDWIERYIQSRKMTGLMRYAAALWPDCEWIFPIDADEFLVASQGLSALDAATHADGIVLCKTNHYLNESVIHALPGQFVDLMPNRTGFGLQPPKVALRPRMLYTLAQGNHSIIAPAGTPTAMTGGLALGLYLREFQVRSFSQFRSKVFNGGRAIRLAEQELGRTVGGDHWKAWSSILEEQGVDVLHQVFVENFVRPVNGVSVMSDPFALR